MLVHGLIHRLVGNSARPAAVAAAGEGIARSGLARTLIGASVLSATVIGAAYVLDRMGIVPVRWAGTIARGGIGQGLHGVASLVRRDEDSRPRPTGAHERANEAWDSLEQHMRIAGPGPHLFTERDGTWWHPATVWPHGQVAAAALDLALLEQHGNGTPSARFDDRWKTARDVLGATDQYLRDGAYSPGIDVYAHGGRLWDDNEWIGLDYLQAYKMSGDPAMLQKAKDLEPFLRSGLHADGGLYWQEGRDQMTRNACSNAPAILWATELYSITHEQKYLDLARNLDSFMTRHLYRSDGLVMDNLADDGTLDATIYSYNQGSAIGADLGMWKATGEDRYLARAKLTAASAVTHFSGQDALWRSSPAFNAIFFRNLLRLDTVAPDPSYRALLDTYVSRAWDAARDPGTGLFNRADIARYDGANTEMGVIDQAGMTQMLALQAMTPQQLTNVL